MEFTASHVELMPEGALISFSVHVTQIATL